MAQRKRIGVLLMFPEQTYSQRVMSGIFSQCEKYDYDVMIFSPQAQVTNYFKGYLSGEVNIFEYINFDLLDGVIVVPLTMNEERISTVCDYLLKKLQTECRKPVVSIDYEMGDYPIARTDDRVAFYHITKHVLRTHKCKNIHVLTGPEGYPVSHSRLDGIKDACREESIALSREQIHFGDFWYTSGENLANRYLERPDTLPDAVICASDHMAIGLANQLVARGVRIPEQVIITGYEATSEAADNTPPITSYAADEARTGALAVNMLHKDIDSMEPDIPLTNAGSRNLCIGTTCGCPEDTSYTRVHFSTGVFSLKHIYFEGSSRVDINQLLESYTSEILTATTTPLECIGKIYESTYLLKPYGVFYLCLNEDWLDSDKDIISGYKDRMSLTMYSDMAKKRHGYSNHIFIGNGRERYFDKKLMLPELSSDEIDYHQGPQVYYFVPVHFNTISLGVAILQNSLSNTNMIGIVFRNYIRNINNALEMIRNRDKIARLSETDMMTELLNRRGLDTAVDSMKRRMEQHTDVCQNPKWLAIMVDMDNLKKINDAYGHDTGDRGIVTVAETLKKIVCFDEACVRSGGDEFVIVGLGDYDEEDQKKRIEQFYSLLEDTEPYNDEGAHYSASAGYMLAGIYEKSLDMVLKEADTRMYEQKRLRKAVRTE